ncbi:MAG: hypothetical protein JST55_12530 [Bacteroidetes bacterium]|nr:hypothetical protein [Bacteroidota bacterium]
MSPQKVSSKVVSKISKLIFIIPVLLISTIIFSSCTTAQSELKEDVTAAVNDSLYISLQKKDTTKFTKTEASYFHKLKEKSKDELTQAQVKDGVGTAFVILGAIGTLVGGFLLFVGGMMGHGC